MKNLQVFAFTFMLGVSGVVVFYLLTPSEKEHLSANIPVPIVERAEAPVDKETIAEPEIGLTKGIDENEDWKEGERFDVDMLTTGEGFHGDEIAARNGQRWLGLLKRKNEYVLAYSKIKIRLVKDDIVDEETEITGKSVEFDAPGEPILLLRGRHGLRPGIVKSSYQILFSQKGNPEYPDSGIELRTGFDQQFDVAGSKWRLRVVKSTNAEGKEFLALVLDNGKITQTLFSVLDDGGYVGSLDWFGDLDRDGKPDFFMSLEYHYNVGYRSLFLSSPAGKKELVRKIAIFKTTGC